MVTIAVVDDDPLVRRTVAGYFAGRPGLDLVAEAAAPEALDAAGRAADVILLDLYYRHRARVDAVAGLAASAQVLVMSAHAEDRDVLAALDAGAMGYLLKEARPEVFTDAVRQVAAGERYFSAALYGIVLREQRVRPAPEPLTVREWELLRHRAQGKTDQQAARAMGIQPGTAGTMLKRIRRKVGLATKSELVKWTLERE
ncbi:response regulator [Actinomadura macrotermitis]|uniref:response regulator n=1 Tax=Actinomadura macrotermitis TaxID=2585200 RepID=UPI00188696EF|nr:response regulator transcription factor [Actinomadura macrotermitis]